MSLPATRPLAAECRRPLLGAHRLFAAWAAAAALLLGARGAQGVEQLLAVGRPGSPGAVSFAQGAIRPPPGIRTVVHVKEKGSGYPRPQEEEGAAALPPTGRAAAASVPPPPPPTPEQREAAAAVLPSPPRGRIDPGFWLPVLALCVGMCCVGAVFQFNLVSAKKAAKGEAGVAPPMSVVPAAVPSTTASVHSQAASATGQSNPFQLSASAAAAKPDVYDISSGSLGSFRPPTSAMGSGQMGGWGSSGHQHQPPQSGVYERPTSVVYASHPPSPPRSGTYPQYERR